MSVDAGARNAEWCPDAWMGLNTSSAHASRKFIKAENDGVFEIIPDPPTPSDGWGVSEYAPSPAAEAGSEYTYEPSPDSAVGGAGSEYAPSPVAGDAGSHFAPSPGAGDAGSYSKYAPYGTSARADEDFQGREPTPQSAQVLPDAAPILSPASVHSETTSQGSLHFPEWIPPPPPPPPADMPAPPVFPRSRLIRRRYGTRFLNPIHDYWMLQQQQMMTDYHDANQNGSDGSSEHLEFVQGSSSGQPRQRDY
ncbi:uncharacterized protein B0H18DRAFT_451853 [Fomitopsis serialis]|uniref:uncharacterized protein n=1 Tax=Fomitopsis serialis TaxID=139415 RepID=UPI002007DFE2|nr:uncharacterized protein B0H18DRAFT_451853 [Neoantrodia serialis]KAH9923895.1 hypothetical protein B0H18DRAFT_451853 [Neoantrodia serialis]